MNHALQQALPTTESSLIDWLIPSSIRELLLTLNDSLRLLNLALGRRNKTTGAYEVLSYKARLELLDINGELAVYDKRKRLRFLRDQVTSFYDWGWGAGETFASHRVRPGHVAERREIGARYRSLVVLSAPQNRGDELTFEVRRRIHKGLLGKRNWLEAELLEETQRLELSVTLPAARRVRSARLLRQREQVESPVTVRTTLQGKQQLMARVLKPQTGELFTLEWDW